MDICSTLNAILLQVADSCCVDSVARRYRLYTVQCHFSNLVPMSARCFLSWIQIFSILTILNSEIQRRDGSSIVPAQMWWRKQKFTKNSYKTARSSVFCHRQGKWRQKLIAARQLCQGDFIWWDDGWLGTPKFRISITSTTTNTEAQKLSFQETKNQYYFVTCM